MKTKRKLGQKLSLFFALSSYLLALICVTAGIYWKSQYGTESPIFASLVASVIFLGGCGIVLHVIANARLPDLKIKSD